MKPAIIIATAGLIASLIAWATPPTFATRFAPAVELMHRQPMIELNDLLKNKIPPAPEIKQPLAKADRLAMGG